MNKDGDVPLLSICIATYNRGDTVTSLVSAVLAVAGNFEVCVHVDGSTDNTLSRLATIADTRLRVTHAENRGRANAIYDAVVCSRGQFAMIYDDDDTLYEEGLRTILADCSADAGESSCGYIYHLESQEGERLGTSFTTDRSNFLRLRADEGVSGDKKEVVKGALLRHEIAQFSGRYRRVPTSLLWSRIALDYDVVCRSVVIGRKTYREGGMSANIARLKKDNPWPLVRLHWQRCRGFFAGRYQSLVFFLRSAAACIYYVLLCVIRSLAGAIRT